MILKKLRQSASLCLIGLCIFFSKAISALPLPILSLDEAIMLAIRHNPNVQIARLSHTLEKFNLYTEEWEFKPHYTLQAETNLTHGTMPGQQNLNIQPGINWQTAFGTTFNVDFSNLKASHYNPALSLQIMQPLMRGFGKDVVQASYNNAKDTEYISRLSIDSNLKMTVSNVINAYLDIMFATYIVRIDKQALKRAQDSVKQTKLFIKAGSKAGNELVTVVANVESAKSELESDKNALLEAKYALLQAIGLNPNSPIELDEASVATLINQYKPISLVDTKRLVLANDIQYQIDQITLNGPTKRALLIAQDNTRWQLNFTANIATGNGSGGGQDAGINSLLNGVNQSQSVGLSLQVPIDDQMSKEAVMSAKIAIKEAEIALQQEKWQKETDAINGWHLVSSANRALTYAASAEQWQKKTYDVNYQKYLHGLIDSLELQSAQMAFIQSEQTLLSAKINYMKALVNLDLLIGHTLKTWQIHVRY